MFISQSPISINQFDQSHAGGRTCEYILTNGVPGISPGVEKLVPYPVLIGLLRSSITPPALGASRSFGSDFLEINVIPAPAGLPDDDLLEKPEKRRPVAEAGRCGSGEECQGSI
jgi:hypothetical protein